MNIVFLDIDGVLNHELFFKEHKNENSSYVKQMIDEEKIKLLNDLCKDVNADVVISSSWKVGRTVDELREIFDEVGATFNIIDKTPNINEDWALRGNEIYKWIKDNSENLFGINYYEFDSYVIIDDDSDMLLCQQNNYFETDSYCGLTYNICNKIRIFLKKLDKPQKLN